jgi:hypothetical protein
MDSEEFPNEMRRRRKSLLPPCDIKRGFVDAIRLNREEIESFDQYPFCIPAVRQGLEVKGTLNR